MKASAGLLMFRIAEKNEPLFFLAHPGGPFFQNKDKGWWTIPKGLPEQGESLLEAACREFTEETGITPTPPFIPLNSVKQSGGKTVHAWAFKTDISDTPSLISNYFELEWPPKSGRVQQFPEIDKVGFFPFPEAKEKINSAQANFLLELMTKL